MTGPILMRVTVLRLSCSNQRRATSWPRTLRERLEAEEGRECRRVGQDENGLYIGHQIEEAWMSMCVCVREKIVYECYVCMLDHMAEKRCG